MKIAVIGGTGKMGGWLANFLRRDGKEVVIAGRNQEKLLETGRRLGVAVESIPEAVRNADVVLLSVSIDSFTEVVSQLRPHVRRGQIVIDVTSVKTSPVAAMHKFLDTDQILGAHPLFGPGAANLSNQNVILTPTSEKEAALAERIKKYLEDRGARVSLMTPGTGMFTISVERDVDRPSRQGRRRDRRPRSGREPSIEAGGRC